MSFPEFYSDPQRPNCVRAYCEECDTWSRPVRRPTERDKRIVRARSGDPLAVVWPDPPKGWGNGCPRCSPEVRR